MMAGQAWNASPYTMRFASRDEIPALNDLRLGMVVRG